jgi:hypothetical protein
MQRARRTESRSKKAKTGIESAFSTIGAQAALDRDELVAIICNEFCRGQRVGDIQKVVKENYGLDLTREQPYDIVRWAAVNGRLQYLAPLESRPADATWIPTGRAEAGSAGEQPAKE